MQTQVKSNKQHSVGRIITTEGITGETVKFCRRQGAPGPRRVCLRPPSTGRVRSRQGPRPDVQEEDTPVTGDASLSPLPTALQTATAFAGSATSLHSLRVWSGLRCGRTGAGHVPRPRRAGPRQGQRGLSVPTGWDGASLHHDQMRHKLAQIQDGEKYVPPPTGGASGTRGLVPGLMC